MVTVTMVTKIMNSSRRVNFEKMAERLPDFVNSGDSRTKRNSVNQNTKKSTSTWPNVWTRWAKNKNVEPNFSSSTKINRCRYMTECLRF